MDKETAAMFTAIRKSIQEAYNITKTLERLAIVGGDIDQESKQLYWDIMYDCAKNIRMNLDKYSFGFIPVNPFEDNEELYQSITDILEARRNGVDKPFPEQ